MLVKQRSFEALSNVLYGECQMRHSSLYVYKGHNERYLGGMGIEELTQGFLLNARSI